MRWQAAEILGITWHHMHRVKEQYEDFGCGGLFNQAVGMKRVRLETVRGICLYRERHFDAGVRRFHKR
jgi:hypothetical protein